MKPGIKRLLGLIFGAAALYAQNTCGAVGLTLTSDYQYAIGTSIGGAAFAWSEAGQTIAQGPITQLGLFHFDSSLQSTSGISPAQAVGASFVPGKFGAALTIATGGVLSYPAPGNVSVIDGTIEMWVALRNEGSQTDFSNYTTLFLYSAANGDQIVLALSGGNGFYGASNIGKTSIGTGTGGSPVTNVTAWHAGEWHHLALTYSSTHGRLTMYLDGRPSGQLNQPIPMPAADGQFFTIGDSVGNRPPLLFDEVRISSNEKSAAEIQYDFSRPTPFANNEVLLPLTGLSAGALAYSVAQSGAQAPCGSATAAYLGIPISNPTPASNLLPAGATSVSLSVQTPAATTCGYSLTAQVPYSTLTVFDSGQGSTTHSATIQGLSPDPSHVNDVYVRCAFAPDYGLHLQYRAVSAANQPFPRLSYTFAQNSSVASSHLAGYALWATDMLSLAALIQLRQANPGVTILFLSGAVDEYRTSLPESYYLHDVNGNRIEGWPGQYYLNFTNPATQAYRANLCYQTIVSNNMLYDGCYFDTFFYPGLLNQQSDYLGNVHLVDAFGTGHQTDQLALNTAWRAGMLAMMADLHQLMPNAYALGHLSPPDPNLAAAFNGESIETTALDVLEGRASFDSLFQRYNAWWNFRGGNAMTIIEAEPQTQIAYGYGVYADGSALARAIPPGVLTFAQSFYPFMRFPLATALMNDGYLDVNLGDMGFYPVNPWFEDFDFKLGFPVGPAARIIPSTPANLLQNAGFEAGLSGWQLQVQNDGQARGTATADSSAAADGSSSAHINIQSPGTNNFHIQLLQSGLSMVGGGIYRLDFWARADAPRTIEIDMQAPNDPAYAAPVLIAIGTSWSQYSASFTAAPTSTNEATIEFRVGDIAGDVWLDDVQLAPQSLNVYRRDFTNGVVLLNGTAGPQTISLESGLQRFKGTQAPLYQYIVDDALAGFTTTGSWSTVTVDSGTRIDDQHLSIGANPPFYHCWQNACHELAGGGGTAQWNLNIPANGSYTLQAWLPAAPNAVSFATSAIYEIVSGSGNVIASATIDQTTAGAADGWHMIATVNLTAADAAFVRLHNGGSGSLVADAIYVTSAAIYNDGSPAPQVTLAPLDGILLQRRQPIAAPSSRVNSVVNAAGFQPSIASGGFVSIGGTGFGSSTRVWASSDFSGGNLPQSLDGISVTINGKPAYLEYISPTQINAIAPDDDTVGQVSVQVTTPQGVSYAGTVLKQKLSPGLFTYSSGSAAYAAAVHSDGILVGPVGSSSRPATPGEVIEIYGSGFGATSPATPAGALVSQPEPTALPVTATIGGVSAPVQWAGLVAPGLYQLNVQVPNVPGGDQQVQVTISGFQSPAPVMLLVVSQ